MTREEFGVSDIQEIMVARSNGSVHFILRNGGQRVEPLLISGKRGDYKLKSKDIRFITTRASERALIKRCAPSEAVYYSPYYDHKKRLRRIFYYVKEDSRRGKF